MALQIAHDFTTLADFDPFPEPFGYGIIIDDTPEIVDEPNPTTYFYALNNKAFFNYSVATPGGQTWRHGIVCSPGTLSGKDASLIVLFEDPLQYYNSSQDEFLLELGLGSRGTNKYLDWVGGLLEVHWQTPSWTTRWKLSTIKTTVNSFNRLDSLVDDPSFLAANSLLVKVKGSDLTASFNGVKNVESQNTFEGGSQVVLWVKCYSRVGAAITNHPIITEIGGQSLRSGRVQPMREMPQHFMQPPPHEAHFYLIPVSELVSEGKLKHHGPNLWEFTQDTVVTLENATIMKGTKGALIASFRDTLPDQRERHCKVKYL